MIRSDITLLYRTGMPLNTLCFGMGEGMSRNRTRLIETNRAVSYVKQQGA